MYDTPALSGTTTIESLIREVSNLPTQLALHFPDGKHGDEVRVLVDDAADAEGEIREIARETNWAVTETGEIDGENAVLVGR